MWVRICTGGRELKGGGYCNECVILNPDLRQDRFISGFKRDAEPSPV